ncbi:hypothetical protein GLOIN_2v1774306 [Rhizophagus irregularis DAOM 181602=DAOM 197198]|uniref:F-box domain-containing protein n=1 Tax=Rhizophagus irregularis (strain DAOM 181602 / DAOM 197198 / MUCL 43194) TaxID=747089 RepID=A0A2P4Q2V7_RHIID|nr:hypothetical protein GLOIN_2v1774306 [Rhizophagus irregularis DAOM 181602=DAOM 197198]POG71922.1 hypothetical protein GLOIN_2v1774306 [Rhizophagus irregularis DAOM 181602=DAOM 197198]|eukprot:XP_025178788.1 hypothetical protein GLOIN_2v1774306 [Rhizophagus irregularis DAOM 181602=DAOM 197198]
MVCSKIFSGDLPELTEEIIQYFRKDISTLYSCILINRLWCRLAIPLLWEDPFPKKDPFSREYLKNQHFIEIYLSKLNEDVKTKLYEYGVNNNLISSNTLLFNYPSFIKYLNIDKILSSIRTWVDTVVGKNQGKLVNLIYKSLLEIFIENEGNLYSFEVDLSTSYSYYFNNIDLILQNPNLTYNIRNLTFRIHDYDPQNIIKLLKFLYSNCNSILSMVLNFPLYDIIRDRPLIEKCLTQIINSQHNLKKISFDLGTTLYNPFLSLKNSNCSNTLNIIIFYYIDFKDIISILQEVFDQLNVLESIHILYCHSLNSDFVQQIIKVNKPIKLRSLFMNEILHVESLQLLLEKFGDYLENFGFEYMSNEYNEPKRQLFKSIMEYCTKIRYFDSGKPYDNNIYLFIKNNQHNINYLTIGLDFIHSNYTDLSSILQNLGQVLPPKLEYLNLYLSFNNTSDLGIFLKNSQNTFIKELLIVFRYDISENILFYIKEYIMKKERVKYLAIISDDDDYELFSLKDEVNEFKLYNITVKKFSDLHFSSYSFINNFDE